MRVHLVGADFEENLGLCMVAAAVEGAGHQIEVLAFNEIAQLEQVVTRVVEDRPDVVGLSIQFQHRAHAFLCVARRLRECGFSGHITCGGQFPTMAWREVLSDGWGVDSVVLHEGECTIVELLDALASGRSLSEIPGIAVGGESRLATCTEERRLEDSLDSLPLARRYRAHTLHVGVPFIPIMGSRGCWGRCSYCSIATLYHDARSRGGARLFRHRSPENIAEEMALLAHGAGGSAVFCFHDDNFLLPRPEDSLRRVRSIVEAVEGYGVGTIGLIGKCRPDSVTADLARELRKLGVVRMFVGVENVSQPGSDHLDRRVEVEQVHRALDAFRDAGIFGCYNLLLFEPRATLEDVEQNLACIRTHASQPVNFCRVEPYCGTPLQQSLAEEGRLSGSYLGYDYRIEDDQVEALFRICAAAFRERNFACKGVHNRYMGLGYHVNLLDRFYDDPAGVAALAREAEQLTRSIALETADFLEEAIGVVRGGLDADRIEGEAGRLALRIAEADRLQHSRLDEVYAMLYAFADNTPRIDRQRSSDPSPKLVKLVKRVAQSVSVGMWLAACSLGTQACGSVDDPVPPDSGVDVKKNDSGPDVWPVDPPPPPEAGPDVGTDVWPVDPPPPPDVGVDVWPVDPPPPPDVGVDVWPVDPPPPPDVGVDVWPVDPPPPPDVGVDVWPVDPPPPPDASAYLLNPEQERKPEAVAGHFRDITPGRVIRSRDLPLYNPPAVALWAVPLRDGFRVALVGGPKAVSLRWQADGEIEGDDREVFWKPSSEEDQISVGVRSRGGVAVVSLRLKDLAKDLV